MTYRTVLVGLAPNGEGTEPLSAATPGSGRRLAALANLCTGTYRNTFDRVNLHASASAADCGVVQDWHAARNLLPLVRGRRVVLLGDRVRRAFLQDTGSEARRLARPLAWVDAGDFIAGMLPHPSGRCRWWNLPHNVAAAAEFMRAASRPTVRVIGLRPGSCQAVAAALASAYGLLEEDVTHDGSDALPHQYLKPGTAAWGRGGPAYRIAFKLGLYEVNFRHVMAESRSSLFVYVPEIVDRGSVFRYEKLTEAVLNAGGTVVRAHGPDDALDRIRRQLIR